MQLPRILIEDPDACFRDLGPDRHDRHVNRTRKTRQYIHELEHLGYTLAPAPAP